MNTLYAAPARNLSTILVLACVIFCFGHPASAAHETSRLTKGDIRDFLQAMSDMSTGNNSDLSSSNGEAQRFMDRHLHKHVRMKSTITYMIPGAPPQQNEMTLDKGQFIQSLAAGAKTLKDYESDVDIGDIRLSKDGRKATVESTSSEQGYMNVPDESGDIQEVPIEGRSECTQMIVLDDKDIMQLYNAKCLTTIQIEGF
ncbi:MAG: hypothetical protein CMH27_09175 [Micavibrio sp.]|nr:hypothetical protein [Micavibrio sp.]|tara:strand:+ start:4758 stop:5357 length:600 start_codon:yes stop_codon:yes gene_type:complete